MADVMADTTDTTTAGTVAAEITAVDTTAVPYPTLTRTMVAQEDMTIHTQTTVLFHLPIPEKLTWLLGLIVVIVPAVNEIHNCSAM